MRITFFSYSIRGCSLAQRICTQCFPEDACRLFTVKRLQQPGFSALEEQGPGIYQEAFAQSDLLVFIGAAGIAVRKIAPYVRDKKTDPAVVCLDERGLFAIPLLSGHIGGANALARRIADVLGARAVVTTATDINGKFAVDEWASANAYVISDMKTARDIAAMILEHDVPVYSDFPAADPWPPGTFCVGTGDGTDFGESGASFPAGIYIGYRILEPFRKTLRIIPPVLRLGVGCRKGIRKEQIDAAVKQICEINGIDERALQGVYSIDLKAQEEGLLEYCSWKGLPFTTYSPEELNQVEGVFCASSFVKSVVGVDNVCERAAAKEGRLIAGKTSLDGVTAALAVSDLKLRF